MKPEIRTNVVSYTVQIEAAKSSKDDLETLVAELRTKIASLQADLDNR